MLLSNLNSKLWQNITFLLYFLNAVGMEEMGIFYVINLRIFCFFVLSRRKEYIFTKKFAFTKNLLRIQQWVVQWKIVKSKKVLQSASTIWSIQSSCITCTSTVFFCNHSIFSDSVSFDSCNAVVPLLHLT